VLCTKLARRGASFRRRRASPRGPAFARDLPRQDSITQEDSMAARRSRRLTDVARNPGGSPAEPFHSLGPAQSGGETDSDDGRINEEVLDKAARRKSRKAAPSKPRLGGTRRRG
jgi:hypothetical protein